MCFSEKFVAVLGLLCYTVKWGDIVTIGEQIRERRKIAGLTQKELGERAGIAEPTIRRYELGRLNPKIETVAKIAKALDVPTTVFYPDNDPAVDIIIREGNALEALAVSVKMTEIKEKLNGNKPTSESRETLLSEKIPYFSKMYIVPETLLKADAPGFIDEYWERMTQKSSMSTLSMQQRRMIEVMSTLNSTGQQTAVARVEELAQIPKYQNKAPASGQSMEAAEPDSAQPSPEDTSPAE